jgi:2-polyprenyl-6-methoxyphenol hydroxylase-like FAD-dependent oxidoreductase
MSPIGGIGINLAIQDAVATANILARPLSAGEGVDHLLDKVQARRLLPTRLIQAGQKAAQEAVIGRVLGGAPITRAAWIVRMLDRFPMLRRIPGRLIGPDQSWMTTEQFFEAIRANLEKEMAAWA